ncbi:hypothetical protein Scep_012343 [Stephania cephalantha]|uniref:Uncharacterized protein n=1 Tax=Stephania cephalantha TaxID=152367 RepID=A0AAP0JFT6_9MAGN
MVDELELRPIRLERPLIHITAARDKIYPNLLCVDCFVEIKDQEMPAYLKVLEFLEFDALLGMDSLATYHAQLECFSKVVPFQLPDRAEFSFQGTSVTLPITRGRVATRIDLETLASVMSMVGRVETRIEEVPVACEFPDVFFDDLPRLPPMREIDFIIDLVSRTKSMSIFVVQDGIKRAR